MISLENKMKKIAVYTRRNDIGGNILITPLVQHLIETFPKADIDIFGNKNSKTVFENFPNTRIIRTDNLKRSLKANVDIILQIRKERYDAAFLINRGVRSAYLFRLGGARKIYGFNGRKYEKHFRDFLFDKTFNKHLWDKYIGDMYVEFLEGMGFGKPKSNRPVLYATDEESEKAKLFIKEHSLEDKVVIAINGGGSTKDKRWLLEKFVQVMEKLQDNNTTYFVFSGSDQKDIGDYITEQSDYAYQFNNQTLGMIYALMQYCDLLIGNDSMMTHAAAAVPLPAVTLFRELPNACKKWTLSYDYHITLSSENICPENYNCYKCQQYEESPCLSAITVDKVVEEAQRLLKSNRDTNLRNL